MRTIEIFVSGRVQKVGFRACVRRIASDLRITGTVNNLNDGRVHIYATAESILLDKFISMLYGCPRAVIREIRVQDIPFMVFEDFSILMSEAKPSTAP
jgi:acylphosphatase